MTHITADDLEIDVTEMGVAGAAFANGVIAEQAARIAELEAQLATEREAKMHETERAQALLKQFRAQKLFEAVAGKNIAEAIYAKYEQVEKERDAAREDARALCEAIDAYLTEKKRLTYSAGYALAEGTPDPHVLALAKLAAVRIEHSAKYLKDA